MTAPTPSPGVPGPPVGRAARRTQSWRRPVPLTALGVLALLLVLGTWGALAARGVARHAAAAADEVRSVRAAVSAGDLAAAVDATERASAQTSAAARDVHSLPITLVSLVPGKLGGAVKAVRGTIDAVDEAVTSGAVPAVREGASALAGSEVVRPDGSIEPAALADLSASLLPATRATRAAQQRADAVDAGDVPPPLAGTVQEALDGVDQLADGLGRAQALLQVMPEVLGADRPRIYLVGFQNTAELRPTGGIIGTWALLEVADGRFTLSDAGSNDDLERLTGQVRDLGTEYQELYKPDQSAYSQNVGLSPHFPYAAQLLTDLWTSQGRQAPDGVIAVDPAGLAPLLRGAGEVAVPGGPSVTADDVEDVVLRQAYDLFGDDNAARKAYLSALVGAAFSQGLGGGAWDTGRLASLGEAVAQGHLQIWSADAAEESQLVTAGAAGALPDPAPGAAGVYLTNISASKLDYYLSESVLATGGCEMPPQMSIGLYNDAPASVPQYVANKLEGVDPTTETLALAVYLPEGTTVTQALVDGAQADVETGTERGWAVTRVAVAVPRQTQVTVQLSLDGPVVPITDVHVQPLVTPADITARGCS